LIVGAAGVATISRRRMIGEALDVGTRLGEACRRRGAHHLDEISSPSPRTIRSTQGASLSTCLYMKVAWMPPRTRRAGCVLLGQLQHALGHVDRWRDGGGPDQVRLQLGQPCDNGLLIEVMSVMASMK
jgi:hypothetical protein